MPKRFNVAAACIPEKHYMVNIDDRLDAIKALVNAGDYFTINRARQYGKTTTLLALEKYLQNEYAVISMDFQMLGAGEFENENRFALSFARTFLRIVRKKHISLTGEGSGILEELYRIVDEERINFRLQRLFETLSDICGAVDKPMVLIIDEVDSASNYQVFLDFLAQLRAYYIRRTMQPAFQSVILAGVYDVKNLKQKIRPQEDHKVNSPWNIAADFKIDMSLPEKGIADMLREYEADYHTGMDVEEMAGLLYDYTSGYPFLVSRLCKVMDEDIRQAGENGLRSDAWTRSGFLEAVRIVLTEKNTLFESLSEKLIKYKELDFMLRTVLFTGKNIAYNFYEPSMNIATMFGLVKNKNGVLAVANRIFDTWLYNLYLSAAELQNLDIYKASLQDKNQFVINGRLNMKRILERFVEHFDDLYHNSDETFIEETGRKYFLLYLRPIINGVGNYYIESQTRSLGRTDIIVDYCGEQYVIETKIWRGNEYNIRGEKQLMGYLEDYHKDKGYMISFNFNKKKTIGVHELVIGDKTIIEAVV